MDYKDIGPNQGFNEHWNKNAVFYFTNSISKDDAFIMFCIRQNPIDDIMNRIKR